MRRLSLTLLLSAGLLSGCIVEAPARDRVEARQQQQQPLETRSSAILGGKVRVLGARFAPGRVRPGEPIRVSLGFEVLAPLAKDYLVFVHLEGDKGARERVNADHVPRNGTYPTSEWQEGEVVRDDFTLIVPERWTASHVDVWMGLWAPEADERLPVTNPEQVVHDGRNRVRIAQLQVQD